MSESTVTAGRPATASRHFTAAHPLAPVAGERCTRLHGGRPGPWVVACGRCWEHTIRTDAVVAAEEGLPAVPVADPGLVDDVAVDRACAGDPVALTPVEILAVVTRLRARGLTFREIGDRLGRSDRAVYRRLAATRPDTAEDTTDDSAGVAA